MCCINYTVCIYRFAKRRTHRRHSQCTYDIFLPTKQDCEMLRKDFVVLISRVLVQYVPELKQYADVVPLHIPHEMSSELEKKSEIVRDASQLSCMIDIHAVL